MVFTSTIFLFWFLPICLLIVLASKIKYQNFLLLLASLLFYSWGEPLFILVMLGSIIINYSLGLLIEVGKGKTYLVLSVIFNLTLLIAFKYANFLADNINVFFNQDIISISKITLPIGISFFTFQALSYIIDVYRKQVASQKNILDLALYISLFPQLIAGPIVRYHDINEQLKFRTIGWTKFSVGVERFVIGFIKKILIADNMAYVADSIFGLSDQEMDTPLAWMGIIAYSFQIYFDFSGYSDMAIGLAKMFGFDLLENFNYPYISKSIKEFWRRWHISLSTWFRDYLYIPLGGNRISPTRTHFNLFTVFLLTGLWHGAGWNFIIWGLYHGFFLMGERVLKISALPKLLGHFYALLVIIVGWVFFRSNDLSHAIYYLSEMFAFKIGIDFPNNIKYLFSKEIMFISILAIVLSVPIRKSFKKFIDTRQNRYIQILNVSYYTLLFFLFILSMSYMVADSYSPFIYFRF